MPVQTVIKLRRDSAADWTSADPILAEGELGLETDTTKIKIGDGTNNWSDLEYFGNLESLNNVGDVVITSVSTGQVLQFDGTNWVNATLDALPDQTGNNGKYLITDGTDASWAALDIPPGTTVSTTAPSSPEEGQMWWDSTDGTLYIYYGTQWVEAVTGVVGPQGPAGADGADGAAGASGATGATGAQGPAGPAGDTISSLLLMGA